MTILVLFTCKLYQDSLQLLLRNGTFEVDFWYRICFICYFVLLVCSSFVLKFFITCVFCDSGYNRILLYFCSMKYSWLNSLFLPPNCRSIMLVRSMQGSLVMHFGRTFSKVSWLSCIGPKEKKWCLLLLQMVELFLSESCLLQPLRTFSQPFLTCSLPSFYLLLSLCIQLFLCWGIINNRALFILLRMCKKLFT